MQDSIWIMIIFVLLLGFFIYTKKQSYNLKILLSEHNKKKNNLEVLLKENKDFSEINDNLKKIIIADDNIFNFLRCINIPQNPFSIVMLTTKKSLEKKNLQDSNQFTWKKELVLALTTQYSGEKIR
jgi:hypothetical protein